MPKIVVMFTTEAKSVAFSKPVSYIWQKFEGNLTERYVDGICRFIGHPTLTETPINGLYGAIKNVAGN